MKNDLCSFLKNKKIDENFNYLLKNALSTLYLGNSVKDTIKASCHLSVYCEEPINIIELEK